MIPIASFLAGSLLSILLPLALFIAVVIWYHRSIVRAPDPGLGGADVVGVSSEAAPPEATAGTPAEG